MDSPERNRIAAASSSATSSPAVQESPFFNFLSNLSPIKQVKAVRYTQRFLDANFPPPPPVFTSPRIDLQREPNFLKRDETNDAGSDVYGQSETVDNIGMIPCSEKEVQSSSPSGHVDDFLADPMEGEDCMNSAELHSRQANNASLALQRAFTGPKEMVTKFINGTHEKNAESGSSISLISLDQADKDCPGNVVELVQHAGNQRDAERFDEFPQFMSKKVVDLASETQHCEQIVAQIAGGQPDEWGCTSQSYSESLQIVEAYEDSGESSRSVPQGSVEEVTQNHRGTRRHLQFERAVNCSSSTVGDTHSSQHGTTNTKNSRLAAGVTRFKSLASHLESGRTSSVQQPFSYSHTTSSQHSLSLAKRPDTYTVIVGSIRKDGNSNIFHPMPSGIGLHLNSIGQASPVISDARTGMKLDGCLTSQEKPGIQNLAKDPNTIAWKISSYAEEGHQESQRVEAATSAAFRSANSMNPPNASQNLRLFEPHSSPFTGGMSDSENAGRNKKLNQVSPPKKRRRAPNISDSEGCKHCNCKRSKCLKLYCECFAAGVYCADSCACENCFNKPEYEDTVLDMRQQIESRNPLAFAPKIVKLGTDSPANIVDDGNRATPSSARHKRGCNCKKSMCLKKYCECYQSKVGCSDGCRCEGCKNSFGTKAETVHRKAGRWEGPSQEKLETADIGTASVDKLKSSFPLRSHYLSPESVSLDQDWDRSKVGETDLFSPTWEGLGDFSHFTPLSHPYPGTVASLDASSSRDFPEVSRARSHQGNNFQSSAGSLHWCNSSISLMPQTSGSKAAHELSSDSALYELVKDDDTPEILKDTTTPSKAVKICSPNKKRVSPPHFRLQELRSSSSPGLSSGRKFILQAVPSFPPLTPYSNSKNGVTQYRSDPKGSFSDQ